MSTVAILLSTYNGEKYLSEQLNSILIQTNVNTEIFVRDDGSTDHTKEILLNYAQKYKNIHLNFEDNVGVGNSFMNLLYTVPDYFDFYAFADQDDIWEENKISEAITMLQKEQHALLYASNQECVDKDGISKSLRYAKGSKIHLTAVSILERNMLAGCTMVFNNRFYKILIDKSHRPSCSLLQNRIHDVWVAMVASLYEGIVYDERSFIKYRQHENNVVGAYRPGFFKRTKDKFKKVFHRQLRNGRSMLASEICAKFPDVVDRYPLIQICSSANTCRGKLKILSKQKELRAYTGESYLSFIFKVVMEVF